MFNLLYKLNGAPNGSNWNLKRFWIFFIFMLERDFFKAKFIKNYFLGIL
jgi:hypothetical protein